MTDQHRSLGNPVAPVGRKIGSLVIKFVNRHRLAPVRRATLPCAPELGERAQRWANRPQARAVNNALTLPEVVQKLCCLQLLGARQIVTHSMSASRREWASWARSWHV